TRVSWRRQRTILAAIDSLLDAIVWVCRLVSGVLMVFLIITMGWLVFGRYVLNNTPTWVEQTALLCVAYITFLGTAVGIRENTHLSIEFLREMLPPAPRAVMRVISHLTVLVFAGFMTWEGWVLVNYNASREIPLIG